MIHVTNLEFQYGRSEFSLRVPSLSVAPGQSAAVIGPSGSGKTTLLQLIAGIRRPDAGVVKIGDVDVTALDPRACRAFRLQRVGLVFQEFELLDYLSVLDNILLPTRLHSSLKPTGDLRLRAEDLARRVGIHDKLRRRVTRLSQGERQRVAICRSLLLDPSVVLADEPTGNLDPANKARTLDILLEYVEQQGAALLAVTHDHGLLPRFDAVCDTDGSEISHRTEGSR